MRIKLIFFSLLLPLILGASPSKVVYCQGDSTFSESDLYDALGLEQPAWYEFWKDTKAKIDPKIATSLQESLSNFYKSEGYYHAKVDKEENNNSITFKVAKGEAVIIQDIQSDLPKRYQDLVRYAKGDIFKAVTFIDIKKDIKKKLVEDGYCNYNFDAKARVDIEKDIVFIRYHLQQNQLCHFGSITIHAPKDIPKKVITSRLNFQEGSPYSSKLIKESYSTLSGLEAFDGVQISQKRKSDIINLNINLKEKTKRIRQEVGVGYETNLGPKGIFRWEERNFHGGAKKISFDLKYSNREKYAKNSFYKPAFFKVPYKDAYYLDFKNEFLYSEYSFENFDEIKYADYLHLLKDYYLFSVDMGLGLEKIRISKSSDIETLSNGNFLLLFPFLKLIIDTRDSKINPKNGIYLSAYAESGIKYFASSTSYSKFIFEGRLIRSLSEYTVAVKGKIGLISEFENSLPESKLFFAGGAFSNRAYGYNRLGAHDSETDEAGAKTLIDTTVEVIHPLYKDMDWALFYDATMISKKSFEFTIDFVHAIGAGLRYHTPIGPVKIDIGINLEQKDQYALHFQIGQSF